MILSENQLKIPGKMYKVRVKCVSTRRLNQDYKSDSELPVCKTKTANYYVQNKCSFLLKHRLMAYIDKLVEQ